MARTFRQTFELEADCKKVETMFNRFSKKHPGAWEVWGGMFEYMLDNGIEHEEEREQGWALWLYVDEQFGTHYMAIVLTNEEQKI